MLHETVAASVTALWAILARLDAGLATVSVSRTSPPRDYGEYPRPSWVEPPKPAEVVVSHVADALRLMRGGDA